jgi:threonine/homoserine/homoserine lactone efflux protein
VAGCLLIGVLVGAALSLQQGATVSMTIREVPVRGRAAGLYASLGGGIADLLVLILLALVIHLNPKPFAPGAGVALATAAFSAAALVVLALRLMTDDAGGELHRERGDVLYHAYHENPVLDRLWGALLNPVAHLFWWTAGLGLLAFAYGRAGGPGMAVLAAGYLACGLFWPTFVAFRFNQPGAERALSDRQFRVVTSLGGLGLAGVGLFVGYRAYGASSIEIALTRMADVVFR